MRPTGGSPSPSRRPGTGPPGTGPCGRWLDASAQLLAAWLLAAPTVVPATTWVVVAAALATTVTVAVLLTAGPTRRQLAWAALGGMFLGAAAVSVLWNGHLGSATGTLLRFALLPLLASAAGGQRVDITRSLWIGALAGAFVSFVAALLSVGWGSAERAVGATTNAILFGQLSLLVAFLAVALCPSLPDLSSRRSQLALLAFTAGVAASLLSGSRGAWLAVPVMTAVLAVQFRGRIDARHVAAVGACLLVAVVAAQLCGGQGIQRVEAVVAESNTYRHAAPATEARATSVGTRLDLWQSAVDGFVEEPVLGIGWGNLQDRLAAQARAGDITDYAAGFVHAHNQYLSSLVSGGVVGLVALLTMLVVPGAWFRRALVSTDDRRRLVGAAGSIIVTGYATFALTESVFERALPIAFFALGVSLLANQLDLPPRPTGGDPPREQTHSVRS